MIKPFRHIAAVFTAIVLLTGGAADCHAQLFKKKKKEKEKVTVEQVRPKPAPAQEGILEFIVEGNDTIYIDQIRASYPYALVAKKLVVEADSVIAADNLKGIKREKYINKVQKELFSVFESQMRSLTVSQGALIMKLVDREVGKSSYNIIKGYKSGITAGFWQGIAKMFGSDLKKPYDPEGEDAATEELVQIWEAGDFPAFYWSIFWKDPPEMPIPEKYR